MKIKLSLCAILLAVLAGYLSISSREDDSFKASKTKKKSYSFSKHTEIIALPSSAQTAVNKTDFTAPAASEEKVLSGEKLLYFNTDEEYESFLKKAHAEGLQINGQLAKLRLVKVVFRRKVKEDDFLARFTDVEFVSDNAAVETPPPLMQTNSVGFKSSPLEFLGITSTKGWGRGVTIAVIDSGVADHFALSANIQHFDLIGGTDELTSYHGTAVASLIVGEANNVKGIAPEAKILDFRALSNEGAGDAFTVATALVMAVDNGARIINMSLGTSSDNPALKEAVLYAQQAGAIIVAAVGNEGVGRVSFPAAYPGVVGVGAVDARENYQAFSNRGAEVDIVAPGVELKAAGLNNSIISFSGTSAAAPLVSATLAYQLSQNSSLDNESLVEILKANSNDAGMPGSDNYYGEGILNVGRIEAASTKQVFDVAASGFFLDQVPASDSYKLIFSGENRGTSTLKSVELSLSFPEFEKKYTFYDVESSQTVYDYIEIPADSRLLNGDYEILLKVSSSKEDENVRNNVKTARIRLQKSSESPK